MQLIDAMYMYNDVLHVKFLNDLAMSVFLKVHTFDTMCLLPFKPLLIYNVLDQTTPLDKKE